MSICRLCTFPPHSSAGSLCGGRILYLRKWRCDSRLLLLHQFLSGGLQPNNLIWRFPSRSGPLCVPLLTHAKKASAALPLPLSLPSLSPSLSPSCSLPPSISLPLSPHIKDSDCASTPVHYLSWRVNKPCCFNCIRDVLELCYSLNRTSRLCSLKHDLSFYWYAFNTIRKKLTSFNIQDVKKSEKHNLFKRLVWFDPRKRKNKRTGFPCHLRPCWKLKHNQPLCCHGLPWVNQ